MVWSHSTSNTCSLLSIPLNFNNVSFSWVLLESRISKLTTSCILLLEVTTVRVLVELSIKDCVAAELLDLLVRFHPRALEDDFALIGVGLGQDVAIGVVRTLLTHSEGHILTRVVWQVGQGP